MIKRNIYNNASKKLSLFYINKAIYNKNSKGVYKLSKPRLGEVLVVKAFFSVDIDGWNKVIFDNDIRHMLNKHGNVKTESKKNQVVVTQNDINNIPYIINNYDYIEKGNKSGKYNTIKYVLKENNITIYLIGVILDDQKRLQIKTIWKKSTTKVNIQRNPDLTSKTDSSMTTTSSNKNISLISTKVK